MSSSDFIGKAPKLKASSAKERQGLRSLQLSAPSAEGREKHVETKSFEDAGGERAGWKWGVGWFSSLRKPPGDYHFSRGTRVNIRGPLN